MAIVRWHQADQGMEQWDSEVNRLFGIVLGGWPRAAGGCDRPWAPPVDMYESKEDVVVEVELPGVSDKDVHVSITGEVLTLRGERPLEWQSRPEGLRRAERQSGKFERILALPVPVQSDRARATCRDGVLTITLPKVEAIKPREIKIGAR